MSPNNSNNSISQIRPPTPDTATNIPIDPNPGSYLSKPDVFRAANSAEALNRAIQSIIPVPSVPAGIYTHFTYTGCGLYSYTYMYVSALPNVPSRTITTNSTTLSSLLQGGSMRLSHSSTIRSSSGPGSTGLKSKSARCIHNICSYLISHCVFMFSLFSIREYSRHCKYGSKDIIINW